MNEIKGEDVSFGARTCTHWDRDRDRDRLGVEW